MKTFPLGLLLAFGACAAFAAPPAGFEARAESLRKQIGVPVEMVDERLTSWEAELLLEQEFGRKSKQTGGASKKKGAGAVTVDSVAATVILREYLERANSAVREAT